jgi:RND family efflux transporter MFP subunit
MKPLALKGRTLTIAVVLLPLLLLFVYVAVRSGPLAPVAVTVATVDTRALAPELFGVGTVEARYTHKVGPTVAGRVRRLLVDVGDRVTAGQVMGEMDPVDLDDRVRAQEATYNRSVVLLREAEVRQAYAQAEASRYEQLLAARSTSGEILAVRVQARQIADAALSVAREDVARAGADRDMLLAQRKNLRFVSPVDGVVARRDVDPGTTVVAGQTVVEVVDPRSLWVHVRFDQGASDGLRSGLASQVVLRSRARRPLAGRVLRVEMQADAVTEEMLAKVVFAASPDPLPSIGELAEVTVSLAALPSLPVVPNAAVQRADGKTGVWQLVDGDLRFTPVTIGVADLEGLVQVRTGLNVGDRIVVYSAKALRAGSRINIVDRIHGVSP